MRKQTKVAAVLSAAALLALGASMTSFAATKGWTQEEGDWYYLDSNGDKVTESWKKSGSNYYWLDENGNLAKSQLVKNDENVYYVDENGARVVNQWVSVENTDGEQVNNKDVDVLYYYMGSSGRAYKADDTYKASTIDGKKYFFDSEGRMVSGWLKNGTDTYYLGDETQGYAHTGWQYLEIDDDFASEYEDEESWYNFAPTGKMRKNTRIYLSNAYYSFDENGVMIDDWQKATENGTKIGTYSNIGLESDSSSFYDIGTGNQRSGWVYTYENADEGGDQYWFYLVSSDKNRAFNAGGRASGAYKYNGDKRIWADENDKKEAVKYENGMPMSVTPKKAVAAKVIKSKTYLFGETGAMLTGVYKFKTAIRCDGGSDLKPGFYYFNKTTAAAGRMETGKTVIDYDGETYTYYFEKTGKAVVGAVRDGYLYNWNGVRMDPENDNSYRLIKISKEFKSEEWGACLEVSKGVWYKKGTLIVSSTGKLKNNCSVTIDGITYTVDKDYMVIGAVDKTTKVKVLPSDDGWESREKWTEAN